MVHQLHAAPIGFIIPRSGRNNFLLFESCSNFTASAHRITTTKGFPGICFSSALILYLPASKYLVQNFTSVLLTTESLLLMITSSPPLLISKTITDCHSATTGTITDVRAHHHHHGFNIVVTT